MIDIFLILIKLCSLIVLPVLLIAAYYKKLDVLTVLVGAGFVGMASMFGIIIIDSLNHF